MFYTKRATDATEPDVYGSGEKFQVASDFKYLGIIVDSKLSFKKQVKKVNQITKFNLGHFRFILKLFDYRDSRTVLQIYDTPPLNILLD